MRRHFILAYNSIEDTLSKLSEVVSTINAALLLSHGIRRNVELSIILVREQAELRISGQYLRNYRPDYESASGLLKKALIKGEVKGINLRRLRHNRIHITPDRTVLVINYRGIELISNLSKLYEERCKGIVIILPGADQYTSISDKCKVYHVSIGKNAYYENQIIAILNILLDNME